MKQNFSPCFKSKSIAILFTIVFFLFGNNLKAQCPGNLLSNSGFESNLTSWSNWGGLAVSTDSYAGTNAGYITAGTASGGGNAVAANAGYAYQLNVFSKITAAATWAVVKVIFYDASWNEIQHSYIQVTSLTYQQYTVNAVAPYGTAWVSAAMYKDAAGEMWADDFCLTTSGASSTLTLGNRIFFDTNGNGKYDNGDWGLDGTVTIKLYEDNNNDGVADGPAVGTTTPASGGYYTFTGLNPGSYFVQLENTPGWMYLIPKNGGDPDNDIDNDNNGISQNTSTQTIKGGTITLSTGGEPGGLNYNSSYDFAVYKYNGLGDYVWLDANGNGVQETGEQGMQNVTVRLINPSNSAVLESTITDATGYYFFADPLGKYGTDTYTIEFVSPAGYKPTLSDRGADDTKDSDPVSGRITNVKVPEGTWDYSLDAGFVPDSWTLPVKLVAFNAFLQNENKVDLKWQTENEDNLNRFEIERSTDGKNFQQIAVVFSSNQQGGKGNYGYTDDAGLLQANIVYYRLRSVDFDNKTSYSDTRLIRLSKATGTTISLTTYPNPVANELRITIPVIWQNKPVVYEIVSMTGQVVSRVSRTAANQTDVVNVAGLQPGVYIAKVSCAGETGQQRIIKK